MLAIGTRHALTALPAAHARAETADVDLELILAVDVSPSVDELEADQQRLGYVSAMATPEILAAIQSGPLGRIAVSYVEWAGRKLPASSGGLAHRP